MPRYLVATASAATTAAACDYLEPKVEGSDELYVLAVAEDAHPITDRDGVLRVAQDRLAGTATVRTIRREGAPDHEIVTFARARNVDEVIIGAARGGAGVGTTTRVVLDKVDVPVFVVPG